MTTTVTDRTGHGFRSATAEQTWQRISPLLPAFGITRVADLTGLDEIGLPTHAAYRPDSRTVAVSMGTGLDHEQARVGAAMESIEAWHAENLVLPTVVTAPARDLALPYDLSALALAPRSPLTPSFVLDWVRGRGLRTGAEVLVPRALIELDFTRGRGWPQVLFRPTSNGLAIGNTADEATLHAMFELIERDCVTPFPAIPFARRRHVDPDTAAHPVTRAVLAAILGAGCRVEVSELTNDLGVPCFAASVWSVEMPMMCGGFGCHLDPAVAVGRALSEAAQSRIGVVSGARDDIDVDVYRLADPLAQPPLSSAGLPRRAVGAPVATAGSAAEALRYCAGRIEARTGVEPFVVDLTHDDLGLPVSKVFAPGLRLFDERALATGLEGDDA
ncbi:YcaO-like family protein [Actinoplanes sp. HUAS TT8]|uniref:YcaO-like family protein n=1 Tax=Actinoplanes sp. HUAS TT8 TaxID=3447453 RepID=UPI003F526853